MTQTSHFEEVMSSVETLSVDEQEVLIQLMQRRLAERRREEIAANIAEAQAEHRTGAAFRGTVEQIINELRQ